MSTTVDICKYRFSLRHHLYPEQRLSLLHAGADTTCSNKTIHASTYTGPVHLQWMWSA